jgi:hypothetical protein
MRFVTDPARGALPLLRLGAACHDSGHQVTAPDPTPDVSATKARSGLCQSRRCAGREGVAISTESDLSRLPTEYLLVFDPATGQLLDSEQILNKSAGKLGVPIPSVIAYTVYLDPAAQTISTLQIKYELGFLEFQEAQLTRRALP